MLKRLNAELYYFKDNVKVIITKDNVSDFIEGYVSNIYGDVSNISGYVSGIIGNVTQSRKEYFAKLNIEDDNSIVYIDKLVE
jgi:hypothetical protein